MSRVHRLVLRSGDTSGLGRAAVLTGQARRLGVCSHGWRVGAGPTVAHEHRFLPHHATDADRGTPCSPNSTSAVALDTSQRRAVGKVPYDRAQPARR